MNNVRTLAMIVIVAVIAFVLGNNTKHWLVRERALSVPASNCYTEAQLEYIIFGESQE